MTRLRQARRRSSTSSPAGVLFVVERRQGQLSRPAARGGRRRPCGRAAHDTARGRPPPHSHGLPLAFVERQAAALGLPLVSRAASWDTYEAAFLDALAELRDLGAEVGVFGDIDLQPHRDWVERVCGLAGLDACLPLWLEPRRALLDELFATGVEATIVTVNTERLGEEFLGAGSSRGWSPSSRRPASMPAARRASSTPWSPPRRSSPRRSRSPGTARSPSISTGFYWTRRARLVGAPVAGRERCENVTQTDPMKGTP